MKFTKMHGIGNDYIYINCYEEKIENPSELAVKLSDRHYGIGGDGIVLIMPSEKYDFKMRMFNSDGSESEMCGNAIRCLGKFVYDNKMTFKKNLSIETLSNEKKLELHLKNDLVESVTVDMGEPILESKLIPINYSKKTCINKRILIEDASFFITCVSMGNPHAVIYVDDINQIDIKTLGPRFENDHFFPKRVNIEFVEILNREKVKMRVWERGSGETLACGTGACAVLVSSVLNHLTERKINVKLLGGNLEIKWDETSNRIFMTGEATKIFDGNINLI